MAGLDHWAIDPKMGIARSYIRLASIKRSPLFHLKEFANLEGQRVEDMGETYILDFLLYSIQC